MGFRDTLTYMYMYLVCRLSSVVSALGLAARRPAQLHVYL